MDSLREGRSFVTSTLLYGQDEEEDEEKTKQKQQLNIEEEENKEDEEKSNVVPIFVSSKCTFVSPNALYVRVQYTFMFQE